MDSPLHAYKEPYSFDMMSDDVFTKVFMRSPAMMVITEADTGVIIEVNNQFEEFYGYSRKEVIGKTLKQLHGFVNDADRDKIASYVMKNNIGKNIELQERTKSGEFRWVSVSVQQLFLFGKQCFVGSGIDITEKKIAEETSKKKSVNTSQRNTETISIPNMRGLDILNVKEIVRFEADGSCTNVFLLNGKKMVSSKAISYFSEQLHGILFFRTHRSHLINLTHVIRYHKGASGSVELRCGTQVPISRSEKDAFMKIISPPPPSW